jgi:hypothetical protein
MELTVYGPFEIPRTRTGLIAHAAAEKRAFWEKVNEVETGLSGACGCYIFALQPPGGSAKPWYVGRTKNAGGFRTECFASHKIVHYNSAISDYERAVPQLYLIAKITPKTHAFAKPNSNGHAEVADLEEFLITRCVPVHGLQGDGYGAVSGSGVDGAGRSDGGVVRCRAASHA